MDVKKAATATKLLILEWSSSSKAPTSCRNKQEPLGVPHLLWLLDGIIVGYVEHEKAHRWLGWAQAGAFNLSGAITLADLEAINKKS